MERKRETRKPVAEQNDVASKVEALVKRYPLLKSSSSGSRDSKHDAEQLVDEMMRDLKQRLAT